MRDENKEKLIQDALNMLDDELILEADEQREKSANTMVERSSRIKNRKSWRYITTIAAGIAVFFLAGTVWNEVIVPNQADESIQEESVVEGDYNYPIGYQGTDSVTSEKREEFDELNATPDISEVTQSESQMLQKEFTNQIHLPNQEVGSAAGVESLARVKIPAMKVQLEKTDDGIVADMLAFFIYEGRCYVQDEYYTEGLSLVGDYVGTSKGLIDEWTAADGYVDFAGSISGKFYEVKGYDPEFMLCMKFDDGAVETFINNNGISLGKGSDLIEERLHLNDNYEKVTFKTQKEWDTSLQNEKNHVLSEEYSALIERFLDDFSSADFMFISDTSLDVNGTGRYHGDMDNYHLTFHTKDGLRFDFILYEDGYVRFQGFGGVCVQIDSSLYEEIISALKAEL
ncbi:MAG: hypothetical protein IJD24_02875 [Agathobacter sp.]|nr:hypothetical protein [Agathobacter sp.]